MDLQRRRTQSSQAPADSRGEEAPLRPRTAASAQGHEERKPQPPRHHNADLAARYQRTMADAHRYHNPPILRRIFLLIGVMVLLWTASRLQLKARSQVRRWEFEQAVARGEVDPDLVDEDGFFEDGQLHAWKAYEAQNPSLWESLGVMDLFGIFR